MFEKGGIPETYIYDRRDKSYQIDEKMVYRERVGNLM